MLICLLVLQLFSVSSIILASVSSIILAPFVACYDRFPASKSAYSKQTAVILIKLLIELCDFAIVRQLRHVP